MKGRRKKTKYKTKHTETGTLTRAQRLSPLRRRQCWVSGSRCRHHPLVALCLAFHDLQEDVDLDLLDLYRLVPVDLDPQVRLDLYRQVRVDLDPQIRLDLYRLVPVDLDPQVLDLYRQVRVDLDRRVRVDLDPQLHLHLLRLVGLYLFLCPDLFLSKERKKKPIITVNKNWIDTSKTPENIFQTIATLCLEHNSRKWWRHIRFYKARLLFLLFLYRLEP